MKLVEVIQLVLFLLQLAGLFLQPLHLLHIAIELLAELQGIVSSIPLHNLSQKYKVDISAPEILAHIGAWQHDAVINASDIDFLVSDIDHATSREIGSEAS